MDRLSQPCIIKLMIDPFKQQAQVAIRPICCNALGCLRLCSLDCDRLCMAAVHSDGPIPTHPDICLCVYQEVTYRKVLEDDGNRQLVEVEQKGRWKFLMFSGSFASRVIAEQNRQEHTVWNFWFKAYLGR